LNSRENGFCSITDGSISIRPAGKNNDIAALNIFILMMTARFRRWKEQIRALEI
jgi:hypothetical protein